MGNKYEPLYLEKMLTRLVGNSPVEIEVRKRG